MSRQSKQSRRRWRRVIVALFLIGACGLWFAPQILVRTSLWTVLLNRALDPYGVSVQAADAQLSWLGHVRVHKIQLRMADGVPLADCREVEINRSLWQLWRAPNDLGTITLHQPHVDVHLRTDGNNVADVIQRLLAQSGPAAKRRIRIHVVDGTVTVADDAPTIAGGATRNPSTDASETLATLDQLQTMVDIDTGDGADWSLTVEQCRIRQNGDTGAIQAGAATLAKQGSSEIKFSVHSDVAPIGWLAPVVRPWLGELQLDGACTADVTGRLDPVRAEYHVNIDKFVTDDTLLASPKLGSDILRFERIQLSGKIDVDAGTWRAGAVQLACDCGTVQIDGHLQPPPLSSITSASAWTSRFVTASGSVAGDLDIAQLSRMLPNTFDIRADTMIDQGGVAFAVAKNAGNGAPTLTGQVTIRAISGRRTGGQRVTWPAPLQLEFAVQRTARDWELQRFDCKSDVVTITGQARQAGGHAQIEADLARIVARAAQFIDLNDVNIRGTARGDLEWRPTDANRFLVQLHGQLRDVEWLTRAQSHPLGSHSSADVAAATSPEPQAEYTTIWKEPKLDVAMSADLGGEMGGPISLQSAECRLAAGADLLTATLRQPLVGIGAADWPLEITVSGDAATWHARLRRWLPAMLRDDSQLAGPLQVVSTCTLSRTRVSLEKMSARIEPCHARIHKVIVDEPVVAVSVRGDWSVQTGVARLAEGTVQTTAAALRAVDVIVDQKNGAVQVAGAMALRADLGQLWQHVTLPQGQDNWYLAGQVEGDVEIGTQSADWTSTWRLTGEDFLVAVRRPARGGSGARALVPASGGGSPWQPVWNERQLSISGRGQVSPTNVSPTNARAEHSAPATSASILSTLEASCDVGWTGATLFGVPVGPGKIQTHMRQRTIETEPVDIELSQGRMRVHPRVTFDAGRSRLTLKPGQVLDNVVISPEMCHLWLAFIAPMVADAASAEGTFSLNIENASIPLNAPMEAELRGTLSFATAHVGPGPQARELLNTGNNIKRALQLGTSRAFSTEAPWVILPPQETHFHVHAGRVYHDRLEMRAGDLAMWTRGSVGLDQSLQLVATVPIQDAWLARDPRLKFLRGQVLEIPLHGTVKHIRPDVSALDDLTKRVLRNTASRLIEHELNNGLQKLLGNGGR